MDRSHIDYLTDSMAKAQASRLCDWLDDEHDRDQLVITAMNFRKTVREQFEKSQKNFDREYANAEKSKQETKLDKLMKLANKKKK